MGKAIEVQGVEVNYKKINEEDYISLTDIARYRNSEEPRYIVYNWMRTKSTVELLGLWEMLHN